MQALECKIKENLVPDQFMISELPEIYKLLRIDNGLLTLC